jgi:hypothetical protein
VALSNGNIWLTGLTEADNFPVTSDAYQKANQVGDDAFLARIGGGSPPPPPPGNFHVYLPMIVD